MFFKGKLKLSLIDDYIKICQIANYYQNIEYNLQFSGFNVLKNNISRIAQEHINMFEAIFLKLKMLDDAFALLKTQIMYSSAWLFAKKEPTDSIFASEIKQNLQFLKELDTKLPKMLKKLNFNDYEIGYILNFS